MKKRIYILTLTFIFLLYCSAQTNETISQTPKEEVSFHLSNLDSVLSDILWCGGSREIVLILTDTGSIYRSTDKGFRWTKMTDLFQRTGYGEIEQGDNVGVVKKIIKSDVDDSLVIFQGSEGINWISEDCGSSIKAMNQGRSVNEFQFHPTERSWLLAAAWSLCSDFVDEPCQIYKELFVSFDLGQNWKLIEDYVVQFSWGAIEKSFVASGNVPKERILLAHEPAGKGHQNIVGWSESVHLSYSDDFFKTFKTIVNHGNKFLLSAAYLYVAYVVDEGSQEVGLVVSNPNLYRYDFKEVELPQKHFKEHSYTILDTTEGQVFLHVNHFGETSIHGNIYISDSTGQRFSSSLLHNVRSLDGQCDFTKVLGLEGIYIANVYDEKKLAQAMRAFEIEKDEDATPSKKRKASGNKLYAKLRKFKKTVVSFDKGGIWKPITAPLKDSRGKKIYCPNDDCTLHLHSVSDMTFGPVYSTPNSVGLLLSTGNVGYSLADRSDEINTYLSRDGGLTWNEVAKGSHIYEIGDHGGLIVLADDQTSTDTILYSWNEGLSFDKLKFTDSPIEISNIIIEPSNTGTSFVVYGENEFGAGVVVGLDFSSLHQRVCKGVDSPNTEESDFEYWTPNGNISPSCLLGRKISYVRRKRENECFNGEEFERKKFIENCECTEEDWECDLGYSREKSGPCKSLNKQEIDYSPPGNCSSYYYVSQGYRKVAGDSCIGGVNHEPLKIPCPGYLIDNKWSGYIKVLFLLLLIVVALLVITNQGLMETIKEKTLEAFINIKAKFESTKDTGYGNIDKEHDNDFGKMVFEENDDQAEPIEDSSNAHESNEKKIAERGGVHTAHKNIPALNKPQAGNKKNERGKDKDDALLLVEDDEESGNFDPRI